MTTSAHRASSPASPEHSFTRIFVAVSWILVLLVITAAWTNGHDALSLLAGTAMLVAAIPTGFWLRTAPDVLTRTSVATCLPLLVSLLFIAGDPAEFGSTFGANTRVLFYIGLAMMLVWLDKRPILVFALIATLHFLGTGFLLTTWSSQSGSSMAHLLMDVGLIWAEAFLLTATCSKINAQLTAAEDALAATSTELATCQAAAHQKHHQTANMEAGAPGSEIVTAFNVETNDLMVALGRHAAALLTATEELASLSTKAMTCSEAAQKSSGEASGNVQSVAAAAEELSTSINEIAGQIVDTNSMISRANESAKQAEATMSELSEAANRVGQVITLIHAIADQTNLLALNATIEAARAGEAGRGFAVVASEVKGLATQTSQATDEVSTHITAIQSQTKRAVEAIGSITATIEDVNANADAISGAINQQGEATKEISQSIFAATQSTHAVYSDLEPLGNAVSQASSATEHMKQEAFALDERLVSLQARLSRFIDDLT
ncbi:methyl-accepting chemotaxis protein [Pseudovibrio exalbescens]|uniref:methyl-accepting chemotaxis protein n=1 Tax=Pseudovibrio exalbescens TaxID=197461 RepID=UPI0015E07A60|nr:methyl-accepting chemotaxis protein [Pseudovibrio exalbescens]